MEKYTNVFFIPHFNTIGGIETYAYELAKKYGKYDITFFYKNTPTVKSDREQIKRISKYCRIKQIGNEVIKCKKLFIMYKSDLSLFEADEIIQVIHCDYKAQNLKPNLDPRITEYYAVSTAVAKTYEEISGKKVKTCYNPLTLEKPKKILRLISATRLTKEKGKDRMIKFAKELNRKGIPFIWLIFTNDTLPINVPNVVYMSPRLDIRDYIADSDYLVQVSDTEAWSYSPIESLSLGTPVIVTPIPCFKEMGIEDGKNGYVLPFDMKDIDVEKIYNKIPKFEYVAPKDIYDTLLINEPSTYDPNKKVWVKPLITYDDLELGIRKFKTDDPFEVSETRANELESLGYIKIVEV